MRILHITIFLICLGLQGCHFSGDNANGTYSEKKAADSTKEIKCGDPKFEFTKDFHKFGKISQGEIVACNFYYKNIGSSDLIISQVESSCGCTAVKWDKKPLAPGEVSKISVEFDSQGRYGKQYKVVTIFANVPQKEVELVITAEVEQ